MQKKRLGVLGGMGPKATSVFFDKVIENTEAQRDQDHIDMVVLNHATLPDRTSVIQKNKGDSFLRSIDKDIKLLENAEVTNIAIPCNTSHYFYDELAKLTNINIINMVEETVRCTRDVFGEGSKVGILATNGTINSGIYERACYKYNMEFFAPDDKDQKQVMDIIYKTVKGGLDIDTNGIESIIQKLLKKHKCHCIIIACTELSCIPLNMELAKQSIDAMDVLVEKSIELSGKKAKHKIANVLVNVK